MTSLRENVFFGPKLQQQKKWDHKYVVMRRKIENFTSLRSRW